jgi:hypothetical protein
MPFTELDLPSSLRRFLALAGLPTRIESYYEQVLAPALRKTALPAAEYPSEAMLNVASLAYSLRSCSHPKQATILELLAGRVQGDTPQRVLYILTLLARKTGDMPRVYQLPLGETLLAKEAKDCPHACTYF